MIFPQDWWIILRHQQIRGQHLSGLSLCTCGTLTGLPSLLKHSLECVDIITNYMFDYVANLIENIRFYVTSEI